MAVTAIEVIYRGIFQKSLSRNICRTIVLAARKEGKIGTAFGRYGDSPERNGIPAKYFAVVADEVRNLAARTSQATVEINEVVQQNMELAHRAVDGMAGLNFQIPTGQAGAAQPLS